MKHTLRTVILLSIASLTASLAFAGTKDEVSDVFVSEVVIPYVLNVDLRTLPPATVWQPGDPIEVIPEQSSSDRGTEADPNWVDPALQLPSEGAGSFSTPLLVSFPGLPFGGGTPPDTVGDVGPGHYIGMTNSSRFQIWDKSGNVIVPITALNSLWDGGSSSCTDGDGDPIVRYDALADRWIMTEFDVTGNTFCWYVSQGPDPVTGGWFVYDFSAPSFPDYPQYGVWSTGYFVGTFESPNLGIYAFDRNAMLTGSPATFQRFTIPQLSGSASRVTRILPSDADTMNVAANNTFARTVDATQDNSDPTDRIELWEYDVDFVTPANSSFSHVQDLIPDDFTLLPCSPGIRDCIPQPGTTNLIDALFNRAMRRLQYRDFGSHETMVTTQVVDAGGGIAGKRWYEIRRPVVAEGAGWSIHQQGTYSPDDVYRFMGSIAMDADGNMALGYSASNGTDVLPSIRATARRADDPLGEMTMEELLIKEGEGVQTSSQRWGDYASMNIDPADGLTFWFTTEIVQPSGQWITHVGSFRLDVIFTDGFEDNSTDAWGQVVSGLTLDAPVRSLPGTDGLSSN